MDAFAAEPKVIDVVFPKEKHAKGNIGLRFELALTPHSPAGKAHGQIRTLTETGDGLVRDGKYFADADAASAWLNEKLAGVRAKL